MMGGMLFGVICTRNALSILATFFPHYVHHRTLWICVRQQHHRHIPHECGTSEACASDLRGMPGTEQRMHRTIYTRTCVVYTVRVSNMLAGEIRAVYVQYSRTCMPYECVFIMSFVTYPLFISSSHLLGRRARRDA